MLYILGAVVGKHSICYILHSVTQTGLTETVVQVGRHKNAAKAAKNATQEEKESLIVSAEGSHELD